MPRTIVFLQADGALTSPATKRATICSATCGTGDYHSVHISSQKFARAPSSVQEGVLAELQEGWLCCVGGVELVRRLTVSSFGTTKLEFGAFWCMSKNLCCKQKHLRVHTRTPRNTTLQHPSTHSDNMTDLKHNTLHKFRTHLDQSRNCLYPYRWMHAVLKKWTESLGSFASPLCMAHPSPVGSTPHHGHSSPPCCWTHVASVKVSVSLASTRFKMHRLCHLFFTPESVVTVRKGKKSVSRGKRHSSYNEAQTHRHWRFNHQFPGGLDEKQQRKNASEREMRECEGLRRIAHV